MTAAKQAQDHRTETTTPEHQNPSRPPERSEESLRSVVILKSNPNTLKNTETFLTNRNWLVFSTTHIQEAMAQVMQKNPLYILIAADHANKRTRKLPAFLKQTLDIEIIVFTEDHKKEVMVSIEEIGSSNNIYPPVSGPSVERMLLKIKKNREHKEDNSSNKEAGGKNRSQPTDSKQTISLNEILSEDDENSQIVSSGASSKTEVHVQKGNLGDKISYNSNGKGSTSITMSHPDGSSPGADSNATPGETEGSGRMSPLVQTGPRGAANGYNPEHPDASGVSKTHIQKGAGGVFGNEIPETPGAASRSTTHIQKGVSSETMASPLPAQHAHPSRRLVFKGDEGSLMVQGAQNALDETTRVLNPPGANTNLETLQYVDRTSTISCLTIASARFSGYLVVAMGRNRKIDQSFIAMIRDRLFQFLKNRGEPVSEEDSQTMELKIEPIHFDNWTMKQAEFLRKTIHNNDEVAMAFFPTKDTQLEFKDSAAEHMLKIDMDHIHENAKLDFDAYIYMPYNDKYVLYTPKNQSLGSDQKSRLKEKGVTHIHLKKDSIKDAKKYMAKSFLHKKMDRFNDESEGGSGGEPDGDSGDDPRN